MTLLILLAVEENSFEEAGVVDASAGGRVGWEAIIVNGWIHHLERWHRGRNIQISTKQP
jgi:hypothetical protein